MRRLFKIGLAATGEAPAAQKYLDRADAQVGLSPPVLLLHRLIVAVGTDPRNLLSGVVVALLRQRIQGQLVDTGIGASAAAGSFLRSRWYRLVRSVPTEWFSSLRLKKC